MNIFDEATNLTRKQFVKIVALLQKEPREPSPPSAQAIKAIALAEDAKRHAEFEAKREALETLIAEAGREEVYAHARALGWGSGAPMWVWSAIAADIIAKKTPRDLPAGGAS